MPDPASTPSDPPAQGAPPRGDVPGDANPSLLDRPSFLDRKTRGVTNWLLIAMAVVFALGFVPRGVKQAILTNVNNAEDWLPNSFPESNDLRWFADHFVSAKFVLISWDGCTLAEDKAIAGVVRKLKSETDESGTPLYGRVLTGPEQVASLTRKPSTLSRSAAIRRLEGALVGPPQIDAESLDESLSADERASLIDQSRATCILAYLTEEITDSNVRMRAAVERTAEIVQQRIGIEPEQVHLGGPPVDNITIDIEGEKTLLRLAGFSGIVGFALSFWCFRSVRLTWFVFSVSGISAGVSLAIVYWYGVAEINLLGYDKKHLGTVDAILMSMPAVVYVLGLSGAIHIVNYYKEERDRRGLKGAAERGVRIGWGPCALAALTTAVGLGSLGASGIVPIRKFGVFSAAGVLATVGVLITMLPICLHLFPPKLPSDKRKERERKKHQGHRGALPPWAARLARLVTSRPIPVAAACLAAMAFFAYGLTKSDSEVRLLKLIDPDTKLIHDYAWFEEHLGNLVPMEVVVTLSPEQLRGPRERSDKSPSYRMTMYERMKMVERIQQRIETLPPVSRAMSAATFGPAERKSSSAIQRRATDFTISNALEESRTELAEYLAVELPVELRRSTLKSKDAVAAPASTRPAGEPQRELWRISARVAALGDGRGGQIDYGEFVGELQQQVEPVLDAYRLRDRLVGTLTAADKPLVGGKIAVVTAEGDTAGDDALMVDLLRETHLNQRGGQLATLASTELADEVSRERYRKALAGYDAVVALSPTAAEAARAVVEDPAKLVTLDGPGAVTAYDRSQVNAALAADASLEAVYTGIVPLVYKTQRELLNSLARSIGWATVLIACVMVVVLRSPGGGIVSMIPNVFPIVSVFGSLGWLGIKIDIGIMMTASVALGVAVDDTIHFLTWFRRGIVKGLDRQSATMLAFERCAVAMTQTTLIAGLGLAVFATSTFTPTQQFGYLMITMLGAALVGDLIMLPAILCGPLGRFFAPGVPARPVAHGSTTDEVATPSLETEQVVATTAIAEPSANGHAHEAPSEPAAEQPEEPVGRSDDESAEPPEPVGATPHAGGAAETEELSPANAALRAKLRKFRRT